jgi:hypothetical protein
MIYFIGTEKLFSLFAIFFFLSFALFETTPPFFKKHQQIA